MVKQQNNHTANNLCPYSLRSQNKSLGVNQEAWDEFTQRGNDVKK